ncbi:MAG: type II secretion system protein GspE, partial [Bacillus sp. (in: firmicutes)]
MKQPRKRLGDLLVEAGLITEEQLQTALKEKPQGQRLGDALLQRGYITEQQLIEVLEVQLGIPHISLYGYPFETNLFSLVPKEAAMRNLLIPIKKDGDKLFVAMADPMDFFAIDDLRLATGFQVEAVLATKDDIVRAINKYYDIDEEFDEFNEGNKNGENKDETITDEDSPIVRLVNQILSNAVMQKAS